ncbi:MAG: helix-turn-helix domain-containing protein [bacterium]
MKSSDVFFIIILSLGALQGIIYGIILWKHQSRNQIANRFLAAILFFFAYRLIVESLKLFGIGYYDFFYHILLEYNWIYGALIFFFVKAYVTPNFKLNLKRDWIHFLPVIIEFIWSNFIKSQNFFWDGTKESLSWLGYWGYVVWMQLPTQYIISALLIIFYIHKSQKLLNEKDHTTHTVIVEKTKWIRPVLMVMKYYSLIVIVVVLVDYLFFNYAFNRTYHYPLFIGMALVTYWLGIEGFNRKENYAIKENLSSKESSSLKALANLLTDAMENDQLYKDPDLNLKKLADHLDAKSYMVTKSLNVVFEKKFNDFINEYRITELKSLLKDPKNKQFTLLSLAFEAGFNSKASFNRAVKKITGNSPSALKESL